MNERVMQFRIGMFVIVAGLVLTMLIVWFGESPSLLREHVYLIARYDEAPGVAEGIAVRKSGIRVGEVYAIAFDERPNQPDGVLVTLALDSKYRIKVGAVPRVSRSLIGDVSIDFLPGKGPGLIKTSGSPSTAPIIEGTVAPDPSKALAAATEAFEKVGDTLKSIDEAATGIAKVTKSADTLQAFLDTWKITGERVTAAADGIDRFIRANEDDFQPAVANFREVAQKLNRTLDPPTQEALQSGIKQFSTAASQLSTSLDNAAPLFKDLGAPVSAIPRTDFGQTLRKMNLISSDVGLLTQTLRDPGGRLNQQGSLQKMFVSADLYENLNRFAVSGTYTFEGMKPVVAALRVFAEKISRDPSSIARGALSR
jgi:phospholipid/cholesterol/gamma-HCH transport system substrate-binding protein